MVGLPFCLSFLFPRFPSVAMKTSFGAYVLANLLIALIASAFSCLSVVVSGILTLICFGYGAVAVRSIAQEGDSARAVAGTVGTVGFACLAVLLLHFALLIPAWLAFAATFVPSVYFGRRVYNPNR